MDTGLSKTYFKYHQKPFYFKDYLKIFNTNKDEGSVLDVGCGIGWFSDYFNNYTGIEYSNEAVNLAKKANRNVILGDVEKTFPFKNGQFSMIILMDILEHLNNPLATVKESFRVIKDGGKVFAFVPDAQKWVWDDYSHKRPLF